MRLIKSFPWLLLCGTLSFVCSIASAQTGTRIPGRIVVAKAIGKVTATNLTDKTQRALANNDVVTQNTSVETGPNSRAVLVFANGATINLGSDATLSIEEFLQDPFSDKVVVSELKEEPTTSVTRLNLARGELVGNVKHLKREKGSSFIVNTPVGAAGIRGTTFRIVFRPDASGKVTFTLSTSEGAILFEAPAAAAVSVETGKEVTVDVDVTVNAATGAVTITSPPTVLAPQDIPAATQATIATAAQQIIETSKDVIITTTTSASTAQPETGAPTKAGEETKAETTPPAETPPGAPKSDAPFTPNDNAVPVINTPQPDVTPGAGAN